MKLTNPTDDQLNAAFAEHVAGIEVEQTSTGCTVHKVYGSAFGVRIEPIPQFTRSMDAVLPWLEKLVRKSAFNDHTITITGENYYIDGPGGNLSKDQLLSRAIVIALLRAHGVEVEFTA